MKIYTLLACAALALNACSSMPSASSAAADAASSTVNAQVGSLTIHGAWARPTTAANAGSHSMHTDNTASKEMAMNSAAYLVIDNKGDKADRLISVASDVAEIVELHETTMKDGIMKMSLVADGAEIPASGSLTLKPASYHIMLMKVRKDLAPGTIFKLTLEFQNAGKTTVDVTVREP